ncbi:MAG TPA: hypothetical protein PK198_21765, partial [Saprospiraceae bacterium]|nr:hypothetical protein [Saprospiraceae bacterium]
LSLGALREAVDFGRQAVDFADRSGEWGQKMIFRTTLADALHQSGQSADAERLFGEAEAMQRERQPKYRFLYSLQGYRYCDLLLGRGKCAEVLVRANTTLKWVMQANWLLDIAFDQFSIAQAHAAQSQEIPTSLAAAEQYFNHAVESIRRAEHSEFIAKGLLARANWRLQTGRPTAALEDLDEVYEIAESGSMGLYHVDWHITMSRLQRMEGDDAAAAQHKEEALRRVRETGYLRRLGEAEELFMHVQTLQGLPNLAMSGHTTGHNDHKNLRLSASESETLTNLKDLSN